MILILIRVGYLFMFIPLYRMSATSFRCAVLRCSTACAFILLFLASPVWASPPPLIMNSSDNATPGDSGGLFDFLNNSRNSSVLLGDMWGLRTWLSQHGMVLAVEETSELLGNLSGGTKTGSAYDGLTEMVLQMDTQRAFGHYGGLLNVSILDTHGNNLSANQLLTLQTSSGIEADRGVRLWEMWYDQKFLEEDRLDVKIGQQSVDQEFMVSSNAQYFMNSSFGWPVLSAFDLPAGGPVYPLSALGVRFSARPVDGTQILTGIFNGSPVTRQYGDPQIMDPHGTSFPWGGGVLAIAEAQFSYPALGSMVEPGQNADLGWTLRVGGWYDSRSFADQRYAQNGLSLANPANNSPALQHAGDYAAYLVLDKLLWYDAKNPNRTLSVFARAVGTPVSNRNLINESLNTGLLLHSPFVDRPLDSVGIGLGYAHISPQAVALAQDQITYSGIAQALPSEESFLELTYQYQLRPWIQLQPDIQYIKNPSAGLNTIASQPIANEWVLGMRANISF